MASVVFLRGVNVGGGRPLRTARLAQDLAALRVTNIGAAGTFVVRARAPMATLRAEFARRLPFETRILVVPATHIRALVRADPLARLPARPGWRRFISVLERAPRTPPRLPHNRPPRDWCVSLRAVHGRFVTSLWRRRPGGFVYTTDVVEEAFGMPATTRSWSTIMRVAAALDHKSGKPAPGGARRG